MAFNFLQNKIEKITKKVQKLSVISEENIKDLTTELKASLLEADVSYEVVEDFITSLKTTVIGQIAEENRSTSQTFLKILNDELQKILGGEVKEWNHSKPTVVMVIGLQGSGKTTTVAKLASYLQNKKGYKNPLLIGLDTQRPAAIDQLQQLAKQNNLAFYGDKIEKSPVKISVEGQKLFRKNNHDLVIYDTAGRLQTDSALMDELVAIKKVIKPTEIIFIADGLAGQEILNVAKEFNKFLKLTSIIITKLDSDTKGGAALSLAWTLKLPINFIGTGEKTTDLERFYPDRMASRLLGLGDIKTLVEAVQENNDETQQERLYKKILAGRYDLDDLLYSMGQMAKMGSVGKVTKLIPGMNINQTQIDSAERRMKFYKYLLNSMTLAERKNPKLLRHPNRRNRIIKGSGRTPQEFNELLRQFDKSSKQMKEMAKYLKLGKMPNLGGNNYKKLF